MSSKAWRFYCEFCNFNKVTKTIENNGLVEFKRSSVQKGVPHLVSGKMENPELSNQTKKYKCPQCGRLVSARQITDVQHIQNEKIKLEELKKKQEEDKVKADSLDQQLEKLITSPSPPSPTKEATTNERPKKDDLDRMLEKSFEAIQQKTKDLNEKDNVA